MAVRLLALGLWLLLTACAHPIYVCRPAVTDTGEPVIGCVPYTGPVASK